MNRRDVIKGLLGGILVLIMPKKLGAIEKDIKRPYKNMSMEIRIGDGVHDDVVFGRLVCLDESFTTDTIKDYLRIWSSSLRMETDKMFLAYRKDRIIHRVIERFGIS